MKKFMNNILKKILPLRSLALLTVFPIDIFLIFALFMFTKVWIYEISNLNNFIFSIISSLLSSCFIIINFDYGGLDPWCIFIDFLCLLYLFICTLCFIYILIFL